VTETFQIVATLAAAQVVLAMAPGPEAHLVATATALGRRHGRAVLAGLWTAALAWAGLAMVVLVVLLDMLPALAPLASLAGGLHLAVLGVAAVRRAFADAPAAPPAEAAAPTRPDAPCPDFHDGFHAARSIAYWLAVFAVTGARDLDLDRGLLVVVCLPTLAVAWTTLLAAGLRRRPPGAEIPPARRPPRHTQPA
jgi:threonine/homoserine/homoserine lactone efflux protein